MALDLNKLSDSELEAIADNRLDSLSDKTLELISNSDSQETSVSSKQRGSNSDFIGVAKKAAGSALDEMTKPEFKFNLSPLDPMRQMAERIVQSTYEESKRPILDASPIQGMRGAQSVGIDIALGALAGTGIGLNKLSKNIISKTAMASDKELVSNIVKVSNKLYDKTAQLLRPSDLAEFIGAEVKHPAVLELSGIIKKSKNAEAAISTVNKTVNDLFSKRAEMLVEGNKVIHPTFIKKLEDYISTVKATDTQKTAMKKVMEEESNKIDYTKYDLLSAQKDKEFFQGLAEKVYKAGGMDELTSGAQQAYATLATGAKELVESVVPQVKLINQRYEGLIKGREMLAKLQDKMIKSPDQTLTAIAETVGRPSKMGIVAAGVRKLPVVRNWGSYKHVSSKIEKLNAESETLRALLTDRIKKASVRSNVR